MPRPAESGWPLWPSWSAEANLAAKQALINEAFEASRQKLLDLPQEEYVKLLAGLAVKARAPWPGPAHFLPHGPGSSGQGCRGSRQ